MKYLRSLKFLLKQLFITHIRKKYVPEINSLYMNFKTSPHEFIDGNRRYSTHCLSCHTTPGILETVCITINNYTKKKDALFQLLNMGEGTGQVSDILTALGCNVFNIDIEIKNKDENNVRIDLNQSDTLPWKIDLTAQRTVFKIASITGNGNYFFPKRSTLDQTLKMSECLIFAIKKKSLRIPQ